jgi:hypothetical protein
VLVHLRRLFRPVSFRSVQQKKQQDCLNRAPMQTSMATPPYTDGIEVYSWNFDRTRQAPLSSLNLLIETAGGSLNRLIGKRNVVNYCRATTFPSKCEACNQNITACKPHVVRES